LFEPDNLIVESVMHIEASAAIEVNATCWEASRASSPSK
jgi:hypothetical protein